MLKSKNIATKIIWLVFCKKLVKIFIFIMQKFFLINTRDSKKKSWVVTDLRSKKWVTP